MRIFLISSPTIVYRVWPAVDLKLNTCTMHGNDRELQSVLCQSAIGNYINPT